MIAIPIAVVLFGYWVLYAGVKKASLADAWNCLPQQQQTAQDQSGRQPGDIQVGPAVISTDCTVRKGDTKVPIPGTNKYMIIRPVCPYKGAPGWLCQMNSQMLGPCGG